MRDLVARFPRRARALAGAYAALSAVSSVSAAKGFGRGEAVAKPLLMPVLAAWTLTAAGGADRRRLALPVAGMLLGGFGYDVLERRSVSYRCDCSRERVERALITLGADDLEAMAAEQPVTEVDCHFCPKIYRFNPGEIRELANRGQSGPAEN